MSIAPPRVAWGFNLDSHYHDLGEMMLELASRYGDCVRVAQLQKWYFINHPDYIRRVLLDNQANYTKAHSGFKRMGAIFGQGLLVVSDQTTWQRQHDLLKKHFQLKNLEPLADITARYSEDLCDRFAQFAKSKQVFNLSLECMSLVLRSTSAGLFDYIFDEAQAREVIADLEICNRYISVGLTPRFLIPTPGNISFHLAKRRLQAVVKKIVSHGQEKNLQDEENFLGTLLASYARHEMSMQELEDQVFTFMVTGHETTGSLLSWVFLCLHQHPQDSFDLRVQLKMQLKGNAPHFSQCESLEGLRHVIDETMRLYPPIWHMVRRATQADTLGPYAIPAGANVIISQYALHRHPAFWFEPEVFRPARFAKTETITRLSYLPFGFGPRTCIAAQLALLQAKMIIATLHQSFDFKIFSSEQVKKEFLISMRPRDGLRAIVQSV